MNRAMLHCLGHSVSVGAKMYSLDDPRYQYRPLSEAAKAKLSSAHRERLGIPDGYCQVYGEHVPLDVADHIRGVAQTLARKEGSVTARLAVQGFLGKRPTLFNADRILPLIDDLVLAYWDHMRPGRGRHPRHNLRGGWWPSRLRTRGWQGQFGNYRCYPLGAPVAWTPLLLPAQGTEAGTAETPSGSVHDGPVA